MSNLETRLYHPHGFIEEPFFAGTRIATPDNCGLYIYAKKGENRTEIRADILLAVFEQSHCSDLQKAGINSRSLASTFDAAKTYKQLDHLQAVTVDDLLQKPWKDGARIFASFIKENFPKKTPNTLSYEGLLTGYGSVSVSGREEYALSAAVLLRQDQRTLQEMLQLYFVLLKHTVAGSVKTKSTELPPSPNYELNLKELAHVISRETRCHVQTTTEQKIIGYSETLHIAGISSLNEFREIGKENEDQNSSAAEAGKLKFG